MNLTKANVDDEDMKTIQVMGKSCGSTIIPLMFLGTLSVEALYVFIKLICLNWWK